MLAYKAICVCRHAQRLETLNFLQGCKRSLRLVTSQKFLPEQCFLSAPALQRSFLVRLPEPTCDNDILAVLWLALQILKLCTYVRADVAVRLVTHVAYGACPCADIYFAWPIGQTFVTILSALPPLERPYCCFYLCMGHPEACMLCQVCSSTLGCAVARQVASHYYADCCASCGES